MRFHQFAFVALLATVASCEPTAPPGPSDPATETYDASLGVDIASMTRVNELVDVYYQDITVGTGATAGQNKAFVATYTGYLTNGVSFDSGDTPNCFLSDSHYIAGWVVGIPGMKVGGKRKLVVGSLQAYGSRGLGSVPPNATLVFDVELKSVSNSQDPSCTP